LEQGKVIAASVASADMHAGSVSERPLIAMSIARLCFVLIYAGVDDVVTAIIIEEAG
jgi:hypothetical protein